MKKESSIPVSNVRVDGGMVENKFLMQLQADLLQMPIDIPKEKEMTAYGAAILSAFAMGEFAALNDVKKCMEIKYHYEPQMSGEERTEKIELWHRAVERSKRWIEK